MEQLFGPPGLIILLVIAILIFGPKQLPKLGKMFGKTMKEVRTGMDEMSSEIKGESASAPSAPEWVAATATGRLDTADISCPKCGVTSPAGTKFCPECGEAFAGIKAEASVPSACPKCGTVSAPGTKFCPECGAPLN